MRIKPIFSVAFNGFVVLTMIAMVSAIAALYGLTDNHRRIAWLVAAIVAVWAIAAVTYHSIRLIRRDRTRDEINALLIEGHQTVLRVSNVNHNWQDFPSRSVRHQEHYDILANWCGRVENVLRKYPGEPYVTRFHLGGSNQQDATSMTIWKMNHRLETLASFLAELK